MIASAKIIHMLPYIKATDRHQNCSLRLCQIGESPDVHHQQAEKKLGTVPETAPMWPAWLTDVSWKGSELKVMVSPLPNSAEQFCAPSHLGVLKPFHAALDYTHSEAKALTADPLDTAGLGIQRWRGTNGACQLSYHWEHVREEKSTVTITHQILLSHSRKPKTQEKNTPGF